MNLCNMWLTYLDVTKSDKNRIQKTKPTFLMETLIDRHHNDVLMTIQNQPLLEVVLTQKK